MSVRSLAAGLALLLAAAPAAANDFAAPLAELAAGELAGWAADPALVAAVIEQNAKNAALAQADIDALDTTWRAEVEAPGDFIGAVMGSALSEQLRARKDAAGGLIGEVFVMDNHGLNVGQSDVTSDYWQGDEEKWQVPFQKGEVHISDVEFDESSQTYLAQVSLPVRDPASGAVIGAVTFGVNVEALPQ